MSTPEPKFWGFPDDYRLTCTDPDEVIDRWLDDAWPTRIDDLPATVEVAGFVPKTVDAAALADSVLERMLEDLDDEYGDPDRYDYTEPTPEMRAAAQAFAEVVVADYSVWQCREVERMTVDVRAWIAAHAPDYAAECETEYAESYRARS